MSRMKSSLVNVVFALILTETLYLGYSYFKQTKVQQSESEVLQTNLGFCGLKNKEEEIEWKELVGRTKSDCKPEEIFFTQGV